ncbi:MAG: rRNA maturation RNase YbeY [Clostridia bacterium]|nr:rRNA maturation RNase YbeY [Clostridia bacterium]
MDLLWEVEEEKNIEELINKVVGEALAEESVDCNVEVSIVVTDNARIKILNNKHRNIDRETDVLSFPGYEKDEWEEIKKTDEYAILGDIVISKEKVIEQAKEYGNTFEREFAYLLTHGMLHLMGYDHMIDEEKMVMRKKEEEILNKLNLSREN